MMKWEDCNGNMIGKNCYLRSWKFGYRNLNSPLEIDAAVLSDW
jgi:hypothetical protein